MNKYCSNCTENSNDIVGWLCECKKRCITCHDILCMDSLGENNE